MSNSAQIAAAIIGSGNIGTDLMIKILRHGQHLQMAAMVGIDPASDGLARANRLGVATTSEGIDGLLALPDFSEIKVVFDATSAGAHAHHNKLLQQYGVQVIDLTPAAIGPYVVPVVNLATQGDAPNLNMVTCGGQATIPMVAAVAAVTDVYYAEIVASVSSRSAGPGTRANIDEFTETTALALQSVGGARRGKAIIILNPAEPPLMMRDTVFCLTPPSDRQAITEAVVAMVAKVQEYVPGYRLKQDIQFETIAPADAHLYPDLGPQGGLKVSIFLEVEGAAHYLPAYAGNLDIMTSAALACGEHIARRLLQGQGA
ncbi:acetaldehyde dehydrogenase (acetylating) [Serratia liquefaciens]|jgi:acetaldehyde dehydrogenase|uniref:Acetaldehyde dehydrogenase n=1 Tax=Serratia liquefaciens TaxID=614 RepID=A0A515CZ41_SERLI|nr:acetaldehyde dehydrogenase (acetylating) [Serratia liquefaciens]QDL33433.1 acetaldehyde dehydrogenase (acetylating) [Serratia liquefaciens]RYM75500.1 acetaldehyde dehydrogenase (acetylating) [Serratia liquefaciens]RYM80068.1 acetaldehyde dehydrogenase (acetylating) [Serratia liquefaciens]